MNEKEIKLTIEQKEEEIRRLKEEIKKLRGNSIRSLVKNEAIEFVYAKRKDGNMKIFYGEHSTQSTYDAIRKVAMLIHFNNRTEGTGWHYGDCDDYVDYEHGKLLQKDMTEEQKQITASFIDDAILLFNKYVKKANPCFEFYGTTYDVWEEQEEQE